MESAKVSIEALSHRFRRVQKLVSRDTAFVCDRAAGLEKEEIPPGQSQVILDELTSLRSRIRYLINEVSQADSDEKVCFRRCRSRLDDYFASVSAHAHESVSASEFSTRKCNIAIGDFLLRRGYFDAVDCLTRDIENGFGKISSSNLHSSLTDYLDIDAYQTAEAVETQITMGDLSTVLSWCSDHGSKLRRLGSSLEFFVRQEQFLSLVYENKRLEALEFAQKNLAPLVDSSLPSQDTEVESEADSDKKAVGVRARRSSFSSSYSTTAATAATVSLTTHDAAALTSRGRAQERARERSLSLGAASSTGIASSSSSNKRQRTSTTRPEDWTFPTSSPFPIPVVTEADSSNTSNSNNNNTNKSTSWDAVRPSNGSVPAVHLEEALRRMVGILAFPVTSSSVPECYTRKLKNRRLRHLKDWFRAEFLRVYSLSTTAPLSQLVKLGLFSLKTPSCTTCSQPSTAPAKNAATCAQPSGPTPVCPVATNSASRVSVLSEALRVLQQHLPGGSVRSHLLSQMHSVAYRGSAEQPTRQTTAASAEDRYRGASTARATGGDLPSSSMPLLALQEHKPACPVCTSQGMYLASTLPAPVRNSSTLICRGSGEVMGQDNPPVALPNGEVYSRRYVMEKASYTAVDGAMKKLFICPATGLSVNVDDQLRPVFIIM